MKYWLSMKNVNEQKKKISWREKIESKVNKKFDLTWIEKKLMKKNSKRNEILKNVCMKNEAKIILNVWML